MLPKPSEENQNQNYIERPYHSSPMTAIEKNKQSMRIRTREGTLIVVGMQTYPDSVKISYGGFPKRLEKELPHDQAIAALGIYPKAS